MNFNVQAPAENATCAGQDRHSMGVFMSKEQGTVTMLVLPEMKGSP